MHPTVLATKLGQATDRILETSKALAEKFQLDPLFITGLQPTGKYPQVNEMERLEGVAALLEALATATGVAVSQPVSVADLPAPAIELEEEVSTSPKRKKAKGAG